MHVIKFIRDNPQRGSSHVAGVGQVAGVTKPCSGRLLRRQRGLGALAYQTPLLLRQSGIKVQHEGIGIPA